MADIRTRESLRTVKTFDRVRSLAAKTRNGVDEAKQEIHDTIASGENSESEYAGNRLAAYESGTAHLAIRAGDRLGRWGVRETRRNMQKRRSRPKKRKFEPLKLSALPASGQPSLLKAPRTAKNPVQPTAKTAKAATKATAQAAAKWVQGTTKAIVATGKATVAAGKGIVAAIAAGGWIAAVVFVLLCAVGMAVGAAVGDMGGSDCEIQVSAAVQH